MYEHLRTEFLMELSEQNIPNIEAIVQMLDKVAVNYLITKSSNELTLYANEQTEKLIKCYLIAKHVEHLSEKTLSRYEYILRHFIRNLVKPLTEVTANDIRLYFYLYKQERRVSDRTLAGIRIALCSFFSWLINEGYIVKNPMLTIKPIRYEITPRHSLSQLELERIREACRDDREKCLIEFLYSTGARASEICIVKLTDIDFITKEVHLFGKGNKHRTSYINAKAEFAIKRYLSTRKHDSEYLFCNERGGTPMKRENIEKIFRRIADETGLKGILCPHVLRHTTATVAVQNGMKVEEVQKLLGHENVATTMIYAEVDTSSVKEKHKRCVI